MMLTELTAVAAGDLPVAALADHLHLGTGFADDGSQDGVLETYLRSALATIEGRTGKAIFQRQFAWVVHSWIAPARQGLPIAPVATIGSVKLIAGNGSETIVDPGKYTLQQDAHRPALIAVVGQLPPIAAGGHAEIVMDAGFGPVWSDVPADLRQAVLMLAAHCYEDRTGNGGRGPLPTGVLSLIEPFRTLRISGSAA